MAVTTKDIARICGLSRTTVDRALHNKGRIKESTRIKVLTTAKELGYQPDLLARSLVKGISMCIGVIVVDLNNQYFPLMVDAMEREAKKAGYLLNITLSEGNGGTEKELIRNLLGHRVDGIIIAPVDWTPDYITYLENLPVPVVVIGHTETDKIKCVGNDEYAAAAEATQYIIRKGYRHLAFVAPSNADEKLINVAGHKQRLNGFLDTVKKETGITHTVLLEEDFCRKAEELVINGKEKIAFLCSGEVFAHQMLIQLGKNGLNPPRNYGLMGFDSLEVFKDWKPAITTIDNHIPEIGRSTFSLIYRMIKGDEELDNITIPYKIIQGETL